MRIPRPSLSFRAVLLAIVLGAWQVAPLVPAPTLEPLVTLSGAESAVTQARCVRVSAQADLVALWLEHRGLPPDPDYSAYYDPAGVPVVDFARCEVVAVFGGATNNVAGYDALPAQSPAEVDAPAVLRVRARSYQTAGPGGGAQPATPWACFVVPRSDGPLVVQQHHPSMGGGPGRVVELARLEAGTGVAAGAR